MSKKQFEAIAAAIRELRHGDSIDIDKMASTIATVCAGSNDRFDEERFLKACRV
jgi:hypothetical protein